MAGHGAEFTKKLRAAIKAKIEELGVEVDEELPDYIMVMVANKKEKNRMKNDLLLFLGKNSGVFVDWLFSFFEKLQNVGSGGGSTDEAVPRSKRTETTEKEEKATTSKSSKEKDSRKEEKSKAKKEDRKRDSPPVTKQKPKLRHEPEAQELAKISEKSSSSHRKESTSSNRNHPREHEEKEKPSKSTRPQIRAPTPPTSDVKKPKHRHEKEKPVEKSSSNKSEEPSLKRHRTIPSRPDYTPETGEEESDGEKERQVLRRVLQEKKTKLKVDPEPSNRVVEGADEDSVDTFDESDYDDKLNRSSPPRKTLKSEVVVQSKPQEMQPKLQSEVVVKGKDLKGRVFGGQSSLFLRAVSDASGFRGQNRPTSRRYQYDSDSGEEGILQVPEVTSIRRTVTNRTVGEKPPKFEEIFNDEPKKHPRFIVTVKGYDGRTVQERPTDPFSDELQERLEDLQKERTPSPTFEEPPKDNELFVGVENFPAEEEAVKKVARKRPKRADDPYIRQLTAITKGVFGDSPENSEGVRAFMKLSGVNPKKAKTSYELHKEELLERVQHLERVEHRPKEPVRPVEKKPRGDVILRSNGTVTKTPVVYRDDSPKTPITPLWNAQSLEIKVADLSSSDDEAEIDELLKSAQEIRSNSTVLHHEIPPTSVLSKPITYAHAAYMPPGLQRRVSQTYMQSAPQTTYAPQSVAPPPTARFDPNKIMERCRFWPNCRLTEDQCVYVHPKKPCANFPNCWFGEKCLYIHPKCKYDSNCTKPNCPYIHSGQPGIPTTVVPTVTSNTSANVETTKTTVTIQNDTVKGTNADILLVSAPASSAPQPSTTSSASSTIQTFSTVQCKFKGRCRNASCTFKHPPRCRFGPNCLNPSCSFWHPVDTSKYKWTAANLAQSSTS